MLSCAIMVAVLAAAPPVERPKLLVLDLVAAGVDAKVTSAVSEALTAQVARSGYFSVVSAREVTTLLGLERQKQALGCSEEKSSCLTELAGALGARFVLSGTVAQIGDAYQLSLQVLDSTRAETSGRSTRLAKDLSALRAQLPYAVAEVTGTPPPPPPSRLVPYAMMGGGAGLVILAGAVGLDGLSRERETERELQLGATQPGVLQGAASYRDTATAIRIEKTLALVGVVGGAALIAAGVLRNQTLPEEASAALVPTTRGFAVVGTWP